MGAIDRFDISSIISKYSIKYYVETGTGVGECLKYVLNYDLEEFHSIEIHPKLYESAKSKLENISNCKIHLGNSYEILPIILQKITSPTLFFMDAHFPGADFGYSGYGSESDYNKRLPLENELKVISKFKDTSKDVILIDDLRIYEDGPFAGGNWDARRHLGGNGIQFIYDIFGKTHVVTKDYRDQGYILLFPHE